MGESNGIDHEERGWLARLTDRFNAEPADVKQLEKMLRDASERQIIDPETLNIIFGALNQTQVRARDIMIPRSQLICVNASMSLTELLPVIVESRHSRFPVIGDELDDVKGVLHAKDLLPLLLERDIETGFDLMKIVRTARVVPEGQPLNLLLQEFRSTRKHMALVVDEYGHISGAVTIEDVLEQIVGEIEDEHDIEEDDFIKQLDANNYTLKATTPIEDFNEFFAADLEESEFDTVGGVVLKRFGHLPERDEVTEVGDFQFTVLSSDSRRITLLHLKRLA
ncbi:MAG: transporter associated domain-containing protein [Pseudomonadota bacterium]